ncbi:DMT family transporter [Alphaproteobacteria bacterium]|nr:DMT family transporter [Alphaproteobacteria bacterium]
MFQRYANWILFFAVGIFWGATIPLIKIVVIKETHPLTLVFWGTVIGLIFIFGWMIWQRIRLPLSAAFIRLYIIVAILGTLIPNSFSYWAAPHLTASEMAVIYSLVPILIFALATSVRQEAFVFRRMVGVLIGLAAMLVLILPEAGKVSGNLFWMLVIFGACLGYAMESVFIAANMPDDVHPIAVMCGMFLAALALITPVMIWQGASFAFFENGSAPEIALVISSVFHFFCCTGMLVLIRRTGAVFTSQLTYVITLAGVFLGILFLGDLLSVWTWSALAVAMVGIYLVQPEKEEAA